MDKKILIILIIVLVAIVIIVGYLALPVFVGSSTTGEGVFGSSSEIAPPVIP